MCARYNLTLTPAELQQAFDLFREPEWTPRYNIAPTQTVLALRLDADQTSREPALLRWGFLPSWAKDAKAKPQPVNARADKVATSGMYRSALRHRRCLIPATGFYEWQSLADKHKQPFHVTLAGGEPMAFAGLWERWEKDDTPIETCCIITTDASPAMQPVHDRMPAILPPEEYDAWLDPETPGEAAQAMLRPFAGGLTLTAVSTFVNNVRNQGPKCVEPV